MTTRRGRGARTQDVVRDYWRGHGFPHAEDAPASVGGRDITGMVGIAPEVKARRGFNPLAWLRQARRNAGNDLPCVVFRPDGMGETTVGEWPVLLRLAEFTDLMIAAGYGDPEGCPLAPHHAVDCPGDACRWAS